MILKYRDKMCYKMWVGSIYLFIVLLQNVLLVVWLCKWADKPYGWYFKILKFTWQSFRWFYVMDILADIVIVAVTNIFMEIQHQHFVRRFIYSYILYCRACFCLQGRVLFSVALLPTSNYCASPRAWFKWERKHQQACVCLIALE